LSIRSKAHQVGHAINRLVIELRDIRSEGGATANLPQEVGGGTKRGGEVQAYGDSVDHPAPGKGAGYGVGKSDDGSRGNSDPRPARSVTGDGQIGL
jgi:hypothetical protein